MRHRAWAVGLHGGALVGLHLGRRGSGTVGRISRHCGAIGPWGGKRKGKFTFTFTTERTSKKQSQRSPTAEHNFLGNRHRRSHDRDDQPPPFCVQAPRTADGGGAAAVPVAHLVHPACSPGRGPPTVRAAPLHPARTHPSSRELSHCRCLASSRRARSSCALRQVLAQARGYGFQGRPPAPQAGARREA